MWLTACSRSGSKTSAEIVRVPSLAHMPLGPRSLHGLANLHGAVLPVVGMRRLLGLSDAPLDDAMRVIVINHAAPAGFVVDRIEKLLVLTPDRIEKDDAGAGSVDPDLLDGVIKGAEGESTIKIVNPARLLRDEFSQLGVSGSRSVDGSSCDRCGPDRPPPRLSESSPWSASISASRNMRCRSTASGKSFNCRSKCRKCRARRPPCSAS